MKYSNNPNDWYFQITNFDSFIENDIMILLSQDSSMLDDQLGSHNLPKKIKDLLRPYFYVDSELMESCFEKNEDCKLSIDALNQILIKLGFKQSTNLCDH